MTGVHKQALSHLQTVSAQSPYALLPQPFATPATSQPSDEAQLLHKIKPYCTPLTRQWPYRIAKRSLDIVGASLGLLLLAPLLLATALAIKLESRGPILFTQKRVGRGGNIFKMYKFRSMVNGAEAQKASLAAQNEYSGVAFKMRVDPRVTRVGRFIRKFSIDELPQLLNILMGDMSIVGPRPVVIAEALKYEPWQMRRFSVTPGLTCLWQVSGRSNISFEDWMRLDLAYIDRWSLWLDLKLILKTVYVVLLAEGAY